MANILKEHLTLMYAKIISIFIVGVSIVFFYLKQNNKREVTQLIQLYSKKHLYNETIGTTEFKNVFLNRKKQTLQLCEVIPLTQTSKIFIFSYPREYDALGLGLCKHIKFFGRNREGKIPGQWNQREESDSGINEICRSYTPIYVDSEKREIHFVIRIYKPTEGFPDGGKMSLYLDSLKVNDTLNVSGPYGLIEYKGNNTYAYTSKLIEKKKHIVMIAGGTGMTPFFRLINYVLLSENSVNQTDSSSSYMTFIYANRNEEEIMLKSIFDEYEEKYKNFKMVYSIDTCLDKKKEKLYDNIGFITEALLKKYVLEYTKLHIPIEASDTLILICGPPSMNTFVSKLLRSFTDAEIIQL